MNDILRSDYESLRSGKAGCYTEPRGLFGVWGKESVQFLNGLITNDVKALPDGAVMSAAFPNAQGRLLAIVSVRRDGDRLYMETEEATREKIWNNIFRFTFAGDFFAEDLSSKYKYLMFEGDAPKIDGAIEFGDAVFVPLETDLQSPDRIDISPELFEVLRIEKGIPRYGIDVDESTIVSEVREDGLISYNKGCYIGQEIIARIHFRGHVAKQLRGLFIDGDAPEPGTELTSPEGKPAGRITSSCFSPKFGRNIALGIVRYDYLAEGTRVKAGDADAVVTVLPFAETT